MKLNKTELMQILIYLSKFYDEQKKDILCSKEDLKTMKKLLEKIEKLLTNSQ